MDHLSLPFDQGFCRFELGFQSELPILVLLAYPWQSKVLISASKFDTVLLIIFEQVPATIDKTRMRTDGLKCGLIIQERKNDIITYRVSTRMVGLKDNVLIT